MASVHLRDATIYGLRIPFVESFAHGTKSRRASDALVVRLTTDEGVSGYGEGIARPYVTGESVDSVVNRIRDVIWPAIRDVELTDDDGLDLVAVTRKLLPSSDPDAEDEAREFFEAFLEFNEVRTGSTWEQPVEDDGTDRLMSLDGQVVFLGWTGSDTLLIFAPDMEVLEAARTAARGM